MSLLFIPAVLAKSHVNGDAKKDGTVVKPHEDKRLKSEKPLAKWGSGAPSVGHKPQGSLFSAGVGAGGPYSSWASAKRGVGCAGRSAIGQGHDRRGAGGHPGRKDRALKWPRLQRWPSWPMTG